MGIVYSDESSGTGVVIPYHKINATKGYLRHYENMRLLDFLAKESTDGRERAEARKELEMAHRKMTFHERHPNFDKDAALRGVEQINRNWKGER